MASSVGFRAKLLDEGINTSGLYIALIDDNGDIHEQETATWSIDSQALTSDNDAIIDLDNSVTIAVSSGTTIKQIRAKFNDNYDESGADLEVYIEKDIGGTDGEEFPDGGEIEVTSFKVQVNDA